MMVFSRLFTPLARLSGSRVLLAAALTFGSATLVGVATPSVASAQETGIPVEIRVMDTSGNPIATAVVRHPEEQERHPVNTITGAYTTDVLFLPDGSEKLFVKGLDLEFEVSAPGFVTANVRHVVRKRRNVIAVTLETMELNLLDDLEEPVIQFGRDRPIDGATPADPAQ